MSTALKTSAVRDQVSAEEWQARVDLASAYRLVALYGWDDLLDWSRKTAVEFGSIALPPIAWWRFTAGTI